MPLSCLLSLLPHDPPRVSGLWGLGKGSCVRKTDMGKRRDGEERGQEVASAIQAQTREVRMPGNGNE